MTAAAQRSPATRRTRGRGRMFGRPGGVGPVVPDVARGIDDQIDHYRGWLRAGCPLRASQTTPLLEELVEACTTCDTVRLDALAGHPSAWVRLGVAHNKHTRSWTLWGDGLISFGLADDSEAWVSASVLLRCPRPPAEVVSTIRAVGVSARSDSIRVGVRR